LALQFIKNTSYWHFMKFWSWESNIFLPEE